MAIISEPVWFSGRLLLDDSLMADAGGQFYSRENAASGGFGHGDLLFGDDSPSLSKDQGIAWVSGEGGVRGGTSILEFAVENHPNNANHSPAFVPEIDDQVLLFSPEAGGNDSIWIDVGAPVMRAFDGGHGYVVTQPEHAATNDAQSGSPGSGYGNPSSFQITSAGADEAGSRLFVGNLTMHSEASDALEVLMAGAEDALPAVQRGGWIADVTYERFAGQRPGETLHTETIHHMESDYAGTHLLYQDVFIP